jgi:hypothetical protein
VAIILLSGCVGGQAEPESHPGTGPLFGDGLGAIQGAVIDDSLVPIVGATVTLDDGTIATTDESGAYHFGQLPPRTYLLNATAPGHASATARVDVIADQVAAAQFALRPLPSANAFFETIPQTGLMACGVGGYLVGPPLGPWTFAACGPLTILGFYDIDRFMLDWPEATPLPDDVTGFIGETRWTSNQALTGELDIRWFVANGPYATVAQNAATWDADVVGSAVGRSPLWVRVIRDGMLANATDASCTWPDKCYLLSGHYPSSRNFNTPVDQTFVFQQRYEDFLTLFHGGDVPLEFTVLPDT